MILINIKTEHFFFLESYSLEAEKICVNVRFILVASMKNKKPEIVSLVYIIKVETV